ncbi:hypothetical protein L6164_007665 [Bauhinia variegata]|uniref:Uncharacterized protein n=1 Tax=Bauhinia variegata TaxID=167791 RepID=A0ACB9PEF7_BAUVA|nr:hypothetical protein L6164_007665 [Bauhinia variegata]
MHMGLQNPNLINPTTTTLPLQVSISTLFSPSPPPPTMVLQPFLFPLVNSTVLPDPSTFFSPKLLSDPLPTNSFFQNYALKNGNQTEYVHPYLINSSSSSLSVSFPARFFTAAVIYQVFAADLTISASEKKSHLDSNSSSHVISSYSDLSVTLDFPSSNLRFFLVRGSPFVTASVRRGTTLSISSGHTIISLSADDSLTKHTLKLNNGQTWLIYTSSKIYFKHTRSQITSGRFSGIIRIAVLPNSNPNYEATLDKYSSCYPVSGLAGFRKPFTLEYRWRKEGSCGDLLMLAHPLHLQLLSKNDGGITVLNDFKYRSIDGELVGVVGDSWVLKADPISVTWHSTSGVKENFQKQIVSALIKDVKALNSSALGTNSSYFYGKLVARAARLALIAEEVGFPRVIPAISKFLKKTIEPWLDGTFIGNAFLYDKKWGGLVTRLGSTDSTGDFGFGIYNDHHFHLGYYLYGIAVLAKIDPAWGTKYKPQAYSLLEDFMTLKRKPRQSYPRVRNFDFYKLHSWAAGLTEFADGRNQESTSEAVNAYYSAALMGMAYGDTHLVGIASTLTAFEILAAQTWWHVKAESNLYEEEFTRENRAVGILWNNKRDSALWFAPAEWRECRLGIQVLPLLPITEALFSDVGYAKELVDWTLPALEREGVGEGWKGFVYALEALYDKENALKKTRNLTGYDDGNSLSNLLWWIHSRGGEKGQKYDR